MGCVTNCCGGIIVGKLIGGTPGGTAVAGRPLIPATGCIPTTGDTLAIGIPGANGDTDTMGETELNGIAAGACPAGVTGCPIDITGLARSWFKVRDDCWLVWNGFVVVELGAPVTRKGLEVLVFCIVGFEIRESKSTKAALGPRKDSGVFRVGLELSESELLIAAMSKASGLFDPRERHIGTSPARRSSSPMVPLVLGLEGDPPHGSGNVAAGAQGSVVCLAAIDGLEDQGSLVCTPPVVVAPPGFHGSETDLDSMEETAGFPAHGSLAVPADWTPAPHGSVLAPVATGGPPQGSDTTGTVEVVTAPAQGSEGGAAVDPHGSDVATAAGGELNTSAKSIREDSSLVGASFLLSSMAIWSLRSSPRLILSSLSCSSLLKLSAS